MISPNAKCRVKSLPTLTLDTLDTFSDFDDDEGDVVLLRVDLAAEGLDVSYHRIDHRSGRGGGCEASERLF